MVTLNLVMVPFVNTAVACANELAGNAAVAPVPPPPVNVNVGNVLKPEPAAEQTTETTLPPATVTVNVGKVNPLTVVPPVTTTVGADV